MSTTARCERCGAEDPPRQFDGPGGRGHYLDGGPPAACDGPVKAWTPPKDAGERLYVRVMRVWWPDETDASHRADWRGVEGEENREAWRALAAVLRAEVLREAIAEAERVRDAHDAEVARLHAGKATADSLDAEEQHEERSNGAHEVAEALRALAAKEPTR